MTGKL